MNDSLKEKERIAIQRLKAFAPKDGDKYHCCYSGGKDSDCIRILAALADVPHEIHHNLTTVDAPETVQYIKTIPGVIIDKATYKDGTPKTMWNLIPRKKLPPTRLMRYCCSEFKENGGKGKLKITGVRWAESIKRRDNGGVVKIIGKPKTVQQYMTENNVNFQSTKQGGGAEPRQCGEQTCGRALLQDNHDYGKPNRRLDGFGGVDVPESLRLQE